MAIGWITESVSWVGFLPGAGITQTRDLDVNVPLEFLYHALFTTLSYDQAKEPPSREG